ncbi:AMP-binding protein (plasmid) [Streptomyces sp. BI20]|uniref:AMP-binding protein n=1 Tax=Streptomyces sp. BI20 TaxID=3403460 RepID=UPI003C75E849
MTSEPSLSAEVSARPPLGLLDRFARQVLARPDAPALRRGAEVVDYAELDARAARLARRLRAEIAPPAAARVAVAVPDGPELPVAVLAVAKAGAVPVVLDPEDPAGVRRALAACRPVALLVTGPVAHARLDPGPTGPPVLRTRDPDRHDAPPPPGAGPEGCLEPAPPTVSPAAEAVVVLSAGPEPRPVPLSQARLRAAGESWAALGAFEPGDLHLFTAGPAAPTAVLGRLHALCSGGALLLPGPGRPGASPTVLHTDPGAATTGPELPATGARPPRLVLVSGDRFPAAAHLSLAARVGPETRVLAVLPVTEAGGVGTVLDAADLPRPDAGGPVPAGVCLLGRPFPGVRAAERDGILHVAPAEGGDPAPTGDLVRTRPDGLLEFRGRLRDRLPRPRGGHLDPHLVEIEAAGAPGVGALLITELLPGGASLVAHVAPPAGAAAEDPRPHLDALRRHLGDRRVPTEHLPDRLVHLRVLPRTRAGREDRAALARPRLLAPFDPNAPIGAKGAGRSAKTGPPMSPGRTAAAVGLGCGLPLVLFVLLPLTGVLWPGSTDLTGVPAPWSWLFRGLYAAELLACAAGLLVLLFGRSRIARFGRGPGATTAAHLALVWLLVAWWPQDNLYRLAGKRDWPLQAALVYAFNIPLMIAAGVLVAFLLRPPSAESPSAD